MTCAAGALHCSRSSSRIRFRVVYLGEVVSTNTLLKAKAEKGAAEGLVLSAEFQTAGRGKPGNQWVSPAGTNLLFSILLRPSVAASIAPIVTQIICRSIASVLTKHYKISCSFKKPNDILADGKKICGVLTEAASSGLVDWIVVGVGLNVNASAAELIPSAISMRDILKKTVNRKKLLQQILRQFKEDVQPLYAHTH